MQIHTLRGTTLIALCMLSCGPSEPLEVATTTASATRDKIWDARPCRSDEIYVDVPVHRTPAWPNLAFLPALANNLTNIANGNGWFCDSKGCPTEIVAARVKPVLGFRPAVAGRHDGHLRFIRIRFEGLESANGYLLSQNGACEAVSTTRRQVSLLTGAPPESFYVGRECDLSAMSLQSSPSVDMLTWHTRRLGLPDDAIDIIPPAAPGAVDIKVIDSAIDPNVAAAVGATVGFAFAGSQPSQHGTAMAILARQIAPTSNLTAFAGIDPGGAGPSSTLTQALDAAVFDDFARKRPVVINLSLGAPAELAQPSLLRTNTCQTYEDPFGESIRYLLDVALRLDTEGHRPTFVVAAAGNRPLPLDPDLFPPTVGSAHQCSPGGAGRRPPWFLPALWHRQTTCHPSYAGERQIVMGTAATDDRDRPSIFGIRGAEPPLVAPGQHVVVANSAADEVAGQCTVDDTNNVTLPATLSGSSVSAALVAGAAARTQATRLAQGDEPLSRDTLARLLYVTGEAVCRLGVNNVPVRRLSVRRLDRALNACPELIACVQTAVGNDLIAASLLAECAPQLADCRLERLDEDGVVITRCDQYSPVPLPPFDGDSTCVDTSAAVNFLGVCAGPCPDEMAVDRYSVGSLGPQPLEGGCPHCRQHFSLLPMGQMSVTILAELNPDLPQATQMTSPWLRIRGPNLVTGIEQSHFVDLAQASPGQWKPGQFRKIELLLPAPDIKWKDAHFELLMDIAEPNALLPTNDLSVLVGEEL